MPTASGLKCFRCHLPHPLQSWKGCVYCSHNGSTFVSQEFKSFLQSNGIKHVTSSPYHRASNGLAERAVKTFKTGLKKMTDGTTLDKLSRFLFAYRNTPQTTTGVSPAELLLGHRLRSSSDLLGDGVQLSN